MFPVAPEGGTSELPPNAAFWVPRRDEVTEEGFGFFRDTWPVVGVSVRHARELMSIERAIAAVVGDMARDEVEFERLAVVAESGGIDDPDGGLSELERSRLGEVVSDVPDLEGLELGVAGLAYALAAVGIVPAASCRSHVDRSWSDSPVVLFAANEYRVRALQPLVEASGCTFELDVTRPELLVVRGRSIENTMVLAELVLEQRSDFVLRRAARRSRVEPTSVQEPLF